MSAAATAAADALFLDPSAEPLAAPRVGPVEVKEAAGGGWSLVASRTVNPGELLLALRPAAITNDRAVRHAYGSRMASGELDGSDAKFLELQQQLLRGRHTARAAAWLNWLPGLPMEARDDTAAAGAERQSADGATAQSASGAPAAVAGRAPPELASADRADGDGSGAEAEADGGLPLPQRLRDNADALADVVQAHCFEPDGGAEDEHAFWARQAEQQGDQEQEEGESEGDEAAGPAPGVLGVWPEVALLRHSCSPNTVAYVVRDTLFVRAARKTGAGSELTVSYLPVGGGGDAAAAEADGGDAGSDGEDEAGGARAAAAAASEAYSSATLLSALDDRRAALEEARGFTCRCSRCRAEEKLDPQLRALMADVNEQVAALREDLEAALAMAEAEEDWGAEEVGEAEEPRAEEQQQRQQQQQAGRGSSQGGRGRQKRQDDAAEEEEEGEEAEGRAAELIGSIADQAGMLVQLLDAAQAKLKLSPDEQLLVQAGTAPLLTLLWAALGARGELEPRLAELMAALLRDVAPGSADELFWALAARDTAEILVDEEEKLAEAEGGGVIRRGGGGFRRQDDRVTIADKAAYRAFTTRYGPISRQVYRALLAARREREDAAYAEMQEA